MIIRSKICNETWSIGNWSAESIVRGKASWTRVRLLHPPDCDGDNHPATLAVKESTVPIYLDVTSLIIKPRNPRNHRPKFQAKFGVPEEEPHSHAGPEVGVNKKSPLGKGASLSTYVLSATGYLFDCRRNHITVMALNRAHRYRGYVTWRFLSHHFLI